MAYTIPKVIAETGTMLQSTSTVPLTPDPGAGVIYVFERITLWNKSASPVDVNLWLGASVVDATRILGDAEVGAPTTLEAFGDPYGRDKLVLEDVYVAPVGVRLRGYSVGVSDEVSITVEGAEFHTTGTLARTVTPVRMFQDRADDGGGDPIIYESPDIDTTAVVHGLALANLDTAAHTVTIYYGSVADEQRRFIVTLAGGERWVAPANELPLIIAPTDALLAVADADFTVAVSLNGAEHVVV